MDETHDHDEPHPWLGCDIVVRAYKKVSMVGWIQLIQVWREGGGEKEEGKEGGRGEREGGRKRRGREGGGERGGEERERERGGEGREREEGKGGREKEERKGERERVTTQCTRLFCC